MALLETIDTATPQWVGGAASADEEGGRLMPPKEQHVAMVEAFMRSCDYVPTAYDVHSHLTEHGLTAQEAEEAIMRWEADLEQSDNEGEH